MKRRSGRGRGAPAAKKLPARATGREKRATRSSAVAEEEEKCQEGADASNADGGPICSDPESGMANPALQAGQQQQQSQQQHQGVEEEQGVDAVGDITLDIMEELEAEERAHPVHDFSALALKLDHANRPLWVCPDGSIFLETYSPIYKQAYDFLIAVAEPVCRPHNVHEYHLTEHSLYAAVSTGLSTSSIISVLDRLSKVELGNDVRTFIQQATTNYGKVKLVLDRTRFFVESPQLPVLRTLMADPTIQEAMLQPLESAVTCGRRLQDETAANLAKTGTEGLEEDDYMELIRQHEQQRHADDAGPMEEEMEAAMEAAAPPGSAVDAGSAGSHYRQPKNYRATQSNQTGVSEMSTDPGQLGEEDQLDVYSFEIRSETVDRVKERCLPSGLNYPMLEEYDFKNDNINPDLRYMDLKPTVRHRPYQEKSLAKMFGNGRARSGIIVLPCGAGKSLVGISAAQRVRKSCLCLVTNSVSVDQWHAEFKRWTTLQDRQLTRFTAQLREAPPSGGQLDICITTYNMVAYSGRRSEQSKQLMEIITKQEWGLLLMDEVHVVPAQMFRKVVGIIKSHCKLGLTATLVREDTLIGDLNFLIGPKLYEANWLDLTRDGHIANVQSNEVWCPMPKEFLREYLKPENSQRKQLLYCLNPYKFQACQYLIDYHERGRGDKVIVFSDNLYALREYATRLKKPFICGSTSHADRMRILYNFKNNPEVNTIFLSKVGDNSIDVPEANVLLQISSHAGSRRQEAQRLGRILRAKQAKVGSCYKEEHDAFFYTLVSKDTQEMYFSAKRQQFLVGQGYSFKVISNLLDQTDTNRLQLHSRDEQLNLLAKILSIGMEDELAEEAEEEEAATRPVPSALAAARRVVQSLGSLSGADGRLYMEYTTS